MDKCFNIHIESAKFLQNLLIQNNIKCYLIGGALINAVRDNGEFKSNDIDFAVLCDDENTMEKIRRLMEQDFGKFYWEQSEGSLSIYIGSNFEKQIDFFKYAKRRLNYYMYDMNWIHEKICHFQTYKIHNVILENKNFLTMHRPDLFLKTIYDDYEIPRKDYKNLNGGNTDHLKECFYYVKDLSASEVDFKAENLKNFFNKVTVKNDISCIDKNEINIFDDYFFNVFEENKTLFYKDFRNDLIRNNIKFDDF
jgi:phosphorylcholine metabolism protein LicD